MAKFDATKMQDWEIAEAAEKDMMTVEALAEKAGVKMGWGTDLIGETQALQRQEFAIRAEVQSAESILHAMYVMNPIILNRADKIGRLSPGMRGYVILSSVDPLANIAGLAQDDVVTEVIQAGVAVRAV